MLFKYENTVDTVEVADVPLQVESWAHAGFCPCSSQTSPILQTEPPRSDFLGSVQDVKEAWHHVYVPRKRHKEV